MADEQAAPGGQESDRRQRLHAVPRGELALAWRSFRVHLDRDELAQERDDLLVPVGRGVELVAPLAPLRPEIDHDRLARRTGFTQRGLEVLPPGNGGRRLRGGGQFRGQEADDHAGAHDASHAPNLTSRARRTRGGAFRAGDGTANRRRENIKRERS
jgi:hypothetical protein